MWRCPPSTGNVGWHRVEVGKTEMPPERISPETQQLGSQGEVAFSLELKESGSDVFAFSSSDHVGDGPGGVVGKDW